LKEQAIDAILEIESIKKLTDGPLSMFNQGLARSNTHISTHTHTRERKRQC
jgi:hypothetical protein